MTIKERLKVKSALIKDYRKQASVCRDLKRSVEEARKGLTVIVDADKEESTNACIKVCHTDLSDIGVSDNDNKMYTYVKECVWFNKRVCPLYSCPHHSKNREYKDLQLLLQRAKANKKVLFNKIFQRIR